MKEIVKKVDKIDGKMEAFYAALGLLNTNIVTYLISYPDKLEELTELLNEFSCLEVDNRCREFGSDYQWSEKAGACVRRLSAQDYTNVE
jgi:hypothetical protein